jgi:pimeloyl-ACP methyl ester carboxylesterase
MSAPEVQKAVAAAERFSVDIGEGAIAGWRWPNAGAPPLIFSHATGFCASAYKKMLQRLAGGFDVYAIDLRGHGRTGLPTDPARLRNWMIYARDLRAFLDRLAASAGGAPKWTLAGHSCGAVVSVLAARGRRDVAALVLVEPVAMPPTAAFAARLPFWRAKARRFPLVKGALARRAEWPDRDDVFKSYERKRLFSTWAGGVLEDYLEDGLVETETGVRLACAPPWEAATFAAHGHDFWGAVAAAPAPITVLGAADKSSTLFGRAPRRFERRGAIVQRLHGVSHLLPLENPEAAADFIAGAHRV